MKQWFLVAFFSISLTNLVAALPPFVQSKREIETILSNQEIYQYIPNSDVILQIIKTSSGYLIVTNHRILPVTVQYLTNQNMGPARFSIEFQKPIESN